MGVLKNCLSVTGESVEIAVFGMFNETDARTVAAAPGNPGFDDDLGEPFLEDNDDDQIGERFRPEDIVKLKCKIRPVRYEEQVQDQTGNAPESLLELTLYANDLKTKTLPSGDPLLENGILRLRANDRLLRIEDRSGNVRIEFEEDGRDGVHVFEVRPGETGTGIYKVLVENRRVVSS